MVSNTSWGVLAPRMTSTSFMAGTGLKKCIPMTGCLMPLAISVMDREEVLDAKMVPSLQMPSSSPSRAFFTAISSLTHSMTRSASAAAAFSSTRMLFMMASLASWVILPRPTSLSSLPDSFSLCFWAEAVELANIRAVWPLAAKTWAMPLPMVPAPKIATFMSVPPHDDWLASPPNRA